MDVDFNANVGKIEIPNSKVKVSVLLIGALLFVAAGIWFIISPEAFMDTGYRNRPKLEVEIVGYITVVFSVIALIGGIYMLFTNKPGLVINLSGILIGKAKPKDIIRWNDIQKFQEIDISRQRFIQVYLKNPEGYIQKQTNWFKKKLMKFTYKRYGAIFSISTAALKCDFDQLYDFLNNSLKTYQEDSKKTME